MKKTYQTALSRIGCVCGESLHWRVFTEDTESNAEANSENDFNSISDYSSRVARSSGQNRTYDHSRFAAKKMELL